MIKISSCLVLKNEGETIYRCLDSIKSFTDEYIIGIDDTTTDNTKDEINRFFDKHKQLQKTIYEFKWNESFSEARNEGMDKASGDYVFIIDGHEFIPEKWYNITERKDIPCHKVLDNLKEKVNPGEFDQIMVHLYQQPFSGNTPSSYFLQPRFYRNDKSLRFNRDAHNVICGSNPEKEVNYPEIILIHDAPESNRDDRKKQRGEMNIKQLKKDIEKNKKDLRAIFYLGNTYLEQGMVGEAIEQYNDYMEIAKKKNYSTSELYQCLIHNSLAHRKKEDNKTAKELCYWAIDTDPTRRDAYCILGDIAKNEEQTKKAIVYFEQALNLEPSQSKMFCNGPVNSWLPYSNLAQLYKKISENEQYKEKEKLAIWYLNRANQINNNPQWEDQLKEWKGEKKKCFMIDSIGSFTKEIKEYLESQEIEVLISRQYDRSLAAWCDFIWQEWFDENVIKSVNCKKPCVIRIHGYEAYLNKHLISKCQFHDKVKIIYVAEHIKKIMGLPGEVVQNGVNTEKFYIKNEERDNKSVGYAGFINEKKNPFLLLKIIKNNPDYTFHLRVDFQSPFWKETFEYELRKCKNVVYHGRYKDLNYFWNTITHVLSTSIIESFSFNVAEAMACGCQPYIYDWNGARDIWCQGDIFTDMPKFKDKIYMIDNRQYIIDHYDNKIQLPKLMEVINGL